MKDKEEYNIVRAFERIEDELIFSMIRNMQNHKVEEIKEEKQWSMWQAEQLRYLEKYRRDNRRKFGNDFAKINHKIEALIRTAEYEGEMEQEIEILKSIKEGFQSKKTIGITTDFFLLNQRKLDTLIEAVTSDIKKAEIAVLRMANDQYRKTIFNAMVYANAGGTYEKAVDMATKDFLTAGLNCVAYTNGARHTLSDYADMAIRTATKRAYLQGEGIKRKEWGISTVIMNKRGNPCPKCLPFCGKVLIDDVWSGGKAEDGPYPLMSYAISKGLYHPRCKDVHSTYFPGISTSDDTWNEKELQTIGLNSKQEAKRQYADRQVKKYERLERYSLDLENRKQYAIKTGEWKKVSNSKEIKFDISAEIQKFANVLKSDEKAGKHKNLMMFCLEFTEIVEDNMLNVPFAYVLDEDVIKYNSTFPNVNNYDMNYVFAHELSHRMDELEYHSWENQKFLWAIEVCQEKVYNNKNEIQKWFELGGKYEDSFAISDIISALSDNEIEVPVGHSKEYWASHIYLKPMELFANLSSIDVLNLDEKESILRELFEAYKELVE